MTTRAAHTQRGRRRRVTIHSARSEEGLTATKAAGVGGAEGCACPLGLSRGEGEREKEQKENWDMEEEEEGIEEERG